MKVPIVYFDPRNGQAANLETRIDELFKEANIIEVEDFHKSYSLSQKDSLILDVTEYYEKNYAEDRRG